MSDVGLTSRQRWQIVRWSIMPAVKHHYLRPALIWLQSQLPLPLFFTRMERLGGGWYRVPNMAVALLVWHRLGVRTLQDDLIRIESGKVTMKGFIDDDRCEFWPIDED